MCNVHTCQLGPNVYVGAGVVIGVGARVREAIILDRAVIQVSNQMSTTTTACVSPLQEHSCVLHSIIGWDCVLGAWSRIEGYPSDLNPNDPVARIPSESLFNLDGRLNPSITILGEYLYVDTYISSAYNTSSTWSPEMWLFDS